MSEKRVVAIGIDPGKDGAMAVLRSFEDVMEPRVEVHPFLKDSYVRTLMSVAASALVFPPKIGINGGPIPEERTDTVVRCVLEHVGAMPGQGSVSMFHFGENFGWIQGVLDACRIPYELVRPQKWKKEFSCTSDKNTSIEVAKRLFPNVDLRRTEKCKGPHDGICEALLMAEYARRTVNG